ncbi:MAG: hypothetical protein JSU08_15250 [Acidobacteria bacterium]|nr:hypothetical protein [Acidobacteriota bacterium]
MHVARATTPPTLAPRDIVRQYFEWGLRPVFWTPKGDQKGPNEPEWPRRQYTFEDYRDGDRVGIFSGTEVRPGEFAADVDIDFAEGVEIAKALLSPTAFVYGRASKPVSHCLYTIPEPIRTERYKDPIDGSMLIELRCLTEGDTVGHQSMAPPSVWSKNGQTEPLEFRSFGPPTLNRSLQREVCLSAIGLLLGKHLGKNGFGHDVRLAWAGFLLRADVTPDELARMGRGLSKHCNNIEVDDVERVIQSTVAALARDDKKVKGGPALAKILGTHGRRIIGQINGWLGREADFIRGKNGDIVKDSQENIRRAIERLDVELSFDEFAERMLISHGGRESALLDDAEVEELWLRIDEEHHFRPTYEFFYKVVRSLARKNAFHPVREYLDQLTWDGVPRIDSWLSTYAGAVIDGQDAAETEEHRRYLAAVSALPLMAGVKRIYEPGAKYDEMLVMESTQGKNKSTAIQALSPRQEWFSDDLPLNVTSKELIERTLGKWIIEASDLAGKRKTEIEHLKATMSRQVDGPARMAYARQPVERKRHFILIGTTNNSEYLNDATGARRFWPVQITEFDIAALKRDRDQLWAEARNRVKAGAEIRMEQGLWKIAERQQEARQELDPWEPLIHTYVFGDEVKVRGDGRRAVTTEELYALLNIEPARRDRAAASRVSQIMQRLGFKRTKVREEGAKGPVSGYVELKPRELALGADEKQTASVEKEAPVYDDEVPF